MTRTAGLLAAAALALGGPAPAPAGGPEEWLSRDAGAEGGERREADEPLETDRGAFTPATSTAGAGRLIAEGSYSFLDGRTGPARHSFPELLVRYGLTERVELRLGHNLERGGSNNAQDAGGEIAGTILGVGDQQFGYGFKYAVTDQDGLRPRSVVIVQGYTPVSGEVKATQGAAGYVFGWELPNRWRLDNAVRFSTNREGEDGYQVWAGSTVVRVPLGEKAEVIGEYFGLFSDEREDDFVRQYLGTGASYHVTPDLELGLRLGTGLNDQTAAFYANVGVGLRY